MKIKRKPRNKMAKEFDTLKPVPIITLEMLGTAADPCFGQFQDPRSPECLRCGDSEICAIAMQQNNFLKRAKVEAEGQFKDLEEKDLKLADPKVVRKMVKARVRELAKLKPQPLQYVIDDIHTTYVMHGYTKKKIERLINRMVEKSSNLSISKNKIKFHRP